MTTMELAISLSRAVVEGEDKIVSVKLNGRKAMAVRNLMVPIFKYLNVKVGTRYEKETDTLIAFKLG